MAQTVTVTLKPESSLLHGDLYQLEAVFGRSSGHGAGFGGEDIHFPFPCDKSCELSVNRSGRQLTISVGRCSRSGWADLDPSAIPEAMKALLIAALREHAEEPIAVEVFQRCD